jgi:ADP-ribose pyrophosphatase YjhB (NUDIX family)|uniref:Nudix hydrolase domain-containing protein n=1 Tax=viral metagenome TaxID=1070528 RepID=A0A6C0BXJ2_9ZZZZ
MYSNNFCNNCGYKGHLFHQCKLPITSNGIVAYNKISNSEIKYLMIRRKDSLGYVDFMRGKYHINNKPYIMNIINEMTMAEKHKLLTQDFNTLWTTLWGDYVTNQYKNEKHVAYDKFRILTSGIIIDNTLIDLEKLINGSDTEWLEPEWGFPKGRRNFMETDIKCAIREFEEETGYLKNNIEIIHNLAPYEESFIGSNYKSYKHVYYIGNIVNSNIRNDFQASEVSKIEWKTCGDAIKSIRRYNCERIDILLKINKIITSHDVNFL